MTYFKQTKIFGLAVLALAFAISGSAQNRTRFGGRYLAPDYAYGVTANVSPLTINSGAAAGGSTVTVNFAYTTLGDGTVVYPLSTLAPINVGIGASQETVTPTSLSNCNYNAGYGTCTVTVSSFTYAHGTGDVIASGSFGLQEAINAASAGGIAVVNSGWQSIGGTTATITSAAPVAGVVIEDTRSGEKYWSVQPTTLTTISAPTTLTNSNVTFTALPVGTWGTSAYYFCVTYVDILGGESPCSASYTQTPGTTAYTLNITSPAASTGAVGWRAYGGITSTALAYLLPITSSACTLTTLESVIPACAIGAAGQWPAIYVSTGQLSPVALGVTNTNNPVPQSHTTFSYQPTGSIPVPFQSNYGPFGSGTIASATAGDTTVLGTIQLPAGYLNEIGRTMRFTGKIIGGSTTTGYVAVELGMVWAAGVTAGAPTAICNIVNANDTLTTGNWQIPFSCTLTTNAVGTTAIGTLQPDGWAIGSSTAALGVAWADSATAAIGSLGLFSQDSIYVFITPTTEAFTGVRLMDLHVETVQ